MGLDSLLEQTIELNRPKPEWLWACRERFVGEFYSGLSMKFKMLHHVVRRSRSVHDVAAYLTLLGRKYAPDVKKRQVVAV